jgi:hypothetical protein
MSGRVRVALLLVLSAVALPLSDTHAQSPLARVALSVTVPPQAVVERVSVPSVDARRGDTTAYRVTVVVRANAPYRVVARRVTPSLSPVTLGVAGQRAQLAAGRHAVQLTRGDSGVATFDITFAVPGDGNEGSAGPQFEFYAIPDEQPE